MTVNEAAEAVVAMDPVKDLTQLRSMYWNLPLWEVDLVDRIGDEVPFEDEDDRWCVALKVWARLKVDGVLVSHVYREDEVLF